ncbi:MAG TPA: tetratricopeptide repeat protein [Ktedonobacteraceae bacterium]|nr:tetratricopeptide repeat protein [Ktedonobacteraceae bacterium]
MPQLTEIERTLRRIRLLTEEGLDEDVLEQLDALHTEDAQMQKEITYTRAWYYTQKRRWSEAFEQLAPLYDPRSIQDDWEDASHTERERRAFYLVWLGQIAVNLGRYEDASRHFTQCLAILDLRRVHLPKIRIKALYGLAMTCIIAGLHALAIQHYQEALKICAKEKLQPQLKKDIADIHHGLTEAYRLIGKFDEARINGRMALQMYEDLHDRYQVCRMYNQLGNIAFSLGEHQVAAEHIMESLSLATLDNEVGMKMINFIAMADIRLDEQRLDEAQRYCNHALETSEHMQDDHHMYGVMYMICGKVTFAKAKQAQGEEACYLLQETQAIYNKAEAHLLQTQASASISELYGRRAEVYEAMNQPQEALACWKSAFGVSAAPKGAGWYE